MTLYGYFLARDFNRDAAFVIEAPSFSPHVQKRIKNVVCGIAPSKAYYVSAQLSSKVVNRSNWETLYTVHQDLIDGGLVGGFFSNVGVLLIDVISLEQFETYKEFGMEQRQWLTPKEISELTKEISELTGGRLL